MAIATIPGYPRIGRRRELKQALEGFWSGNTTAEQLRAVAAHVRADAWSAQLAAGIDLIPVNDFSLYDQMLDMSALFGAVPERYGWEGNDVDLDTLFAMARGRTGDAGVRALDMTKWFDTNYHYLVPELTADQTFRLAATKPFDELSEAMAAGVTAKPALVGPITYLLLSRSSDNAPLSLLERLLPVYAEVVSKLAEMGATWIQLDETALVGDRTPDELRALERAYAVIVSAAGNAKVTVHTGFGHTGDAYQTLVNLPVAGIGLDFVSGPENLEHIVRHGFPSDKWLAAGVIDGRNVWAADLTKKLDLLTKLQEHVSAERIMVSASCSLLHVPYDVRLETELDPEIRSWLAFADQKLSEIELLTRAVNDGRDAISAELDSNRRMIADRQQSPVRNNPLVRERLANQNGATAGRSNPYRERAVRQRERLDLPALPTTTIGSFPQTKELRAVRRRFESGAIDRAMYEQFIEQQIREIVGWQERAGLDVLVHGEPERNDMVQYFGEQLDGFAFTRHGWVQSYGSRCVRPPVIYGDVQRRTPMTVRWASFAQSLTNLPVKGMLTGPVTMLNWSFVRDDQPNAETCRQIALAIRDEVADLDAAGIAVIQIDEPALREGLPLRRAEWDAYLAWATASFRISSSAARPETQIHTHMCYSEFGDVIDAISALDADVISIENARSGLELLEVFQEHGYDKGIGPGVYDIHSPRVPSVEEIAGNVRATLSVLEPSQVWINPDCGLKTRAPEEAHAALEHMVAAARAVRDELSAPEGA